MAKSSIIENYISLDIETTGFSRTNDQIIEIAAIEYKMGKKVAEFATLVNPGISIPAPITALTGITQSDVAAAPSLDAVIPDFLAFIGDKPLLGHNLHTFDIPFLECKMGRILENWAIDSIYLAKRCFPGLPSYKLSYLKDVFQLDGGTSHRALADAETSNALLWACLLSEQYEFQYNQALLHADEFQEAKEHKRRGFAYKKACVREIYPTVEDINTSSALYGKNIAFTGDLSIPRGDAMQLAVNAGAFVKTSVSKKTDYLVVGWQNVSLVGDDGRSEKEETAQALNASGKANIKIITEEEFAKLLTTVSQEPAQNCFTTDQELYQALLDASQDQLQQMGIPNEMLVVKEISNATVVCLLDPNRPLCYIRVKKTGSTISFFADAGKALPHNKLMIHRLENPSLVRATVASKDDVARCVDAFILAIKNKIQAYHTFDCCSRYEACSDAKRCLHPSPAEGLGCTYGKRLREGQIFYGKNKNIP